jgi:hypothetical protein
MRHRLVPLVESLEDKLSTSTVDLSFGMVRIRADLGGVGNHSSTAEVSSGVLTVTLDGDAYTFNASAVKSLFYVGQPGDDVFTNDTSYATIAIGNGGVDTYFLISPSPSSIQIVQGFAFG